MIADQKIGKSFLGALNYNLKKLYHPDKDKRAEVLDHNFSSIDSKMIQKELRLVRSLRPNLNRYVYHTSLNFSNDDELDNDKLLNIAHDYLKKSGYTNNQYIIFRHHDADHPHIHLLVNRICFNGSVVSDSNNYKRSEAILRQLEYQYNLIKVEQSNHLSKDQYNSVTKEQNISVTENLSNGISTDPANGITEELNNDLSSERRNGITTERSNNSTTHQNNRVPKEQNNNSTIDRSSTISQRAPTKNELEMYRRTRKPSDKMVLQELMKKLLKVEGLTVPDMITKAKKTGIYFLFNQASTGRVTGITYFYNDFKAKGQALGNQFKWGEIIRIVDYNQERDSEAIRQENELTKGKFDNSENGHQTPLQASQDKVTLNLENNVDLGSRVHTISINIAHDEDDAKKYRRRGRSR